MKTNQNQNCRTRMILSGLFVLLMVLFFGANNPIQASQVGDDCGDEPVDVCIMLDRTGSVSDTERQAEEDAAKALVDLILNVNANPNTRVAVGAFGSSAADNPAVLIQALSSDATDLKNDITNAMANASAFESGGACGNRGTNIITAVQVCRNELGNGLNTTQAFILVSDGDGNQPREEVMGVCQPSIANLRAAITAEANAAKNTDGIEIFSIAFDAATGGTQSGNFSSDPSNRAFLAGLASQPSDDDSIGAVDAGEQTAENGDMDHFFIAPMADSLEGIFEAIVGDLSCVDEDDDPCSTLICGQEDTCESVPTNQGQPCDDDDLCTPSSTCNEGSCEGTPITCNPSDQCHDAGVCNPDTGLCSDPPKQDGSSCNDNNPCTTPDTCQGGGCGGIPVVCAPPAQCFQPGICDVSDGICDYAPSSAGTSCGDPTSCNGNEICNGAGVCNPGTPVNCDPVNPCKSGECQEPGGTCAETNLPNGTPCGPDESLCFEVPVCSGGECQPAVPVNCNDDNACTTDSCNEEVGCTHTPIDCDDGDACTNDSCNPVNGCQTSDVNCNDNNTCTDDLCNSDTGCANVDNGTCDGDGDGDGGGGPLVPSVPIGVTGIFEGSGTPGCSINGLNGTPLSSVLGILALLLPGLLRMALGKVRR